MDRIINVKVGGNYLSKDNKNAGVRGEGNVTMLRITFDEGWDGYAKTVTFWDALGGNPVKRTLTADLIENITEDIRVYLVPIPAEPMAEAGMLTFVIDGYLEGKRQRSIADKLVVKDSPETDNAEEPADPTPTQAEQLQGQIDKFMDDVQMAVIARDETKSYRDEAEEFSQKATENATSAEINAKITVEKATEAVESALKAETAVGKTSYIGANGNWYAWDSKISAFYDTGVKAQSGSTVYSGNNPPPEAEVWIIPDGDGDEITRIIEAGDAKTLRIAKVYTDEQTEIIKSDVEGLQKQINEEAHFRGYLSTNAKIQALEATPNDFAYSAESGTKWIYDAVDGWRDSGSSVPDQLTPASDTTPLINGEASAGTENAYARGDHRHPTDTTRASVTALNTKADKPIIKIVDAIAFGLDFSLNNNRIIRCGTLHAMSFNFSNGEYPEDYGLDLSFDSGATPTTISYSASGIINWVGTDCSTVDGLSIFQPSANTHYDIVFYYNGNQFIGLVNGFVPSSRNVVSE